MNRNTSFVVGCAAVAIALGTSGAALADDNSMSPLTGDSYAYFNGLDYVAGGFSVAAVRPSHAASEASVRPGAAQSPPQPERPVMLAGRTPAGSPWTAPRIFDDGTGA